MAEKKLTPAQARALIAATLNDGYRASQVKNIDKVKAVLTPEQIQRTIDKTLKGSTVAKDAQLKPGKTVIGPLAKGASGGVPGLALGAVAAYKAELKAAAEAKKKKNRMN